MSAFECPVCFSNYEFRDHLPLVLPSCGHTVCYSCISQLSSPKHCPIDRSYITTPVEQLPKNYALLAAASYATNVETVSYLEELGRKAATQVYISIEQLHFLSIINLVSHTPIEANFNGKQVLIRPLPNHTRHSPGELISAAAGLVCSSIHFRHTTMVYGICIVDDTPCAVFQRQATSLIRTLPVSGVSLDAALQTIIAVAKGLVELHAVGFHHGAVGAHSVALDEFADPMLDLTAMASSALEASATTSLIQGGGSFTAQHGSSPEAKQDVHQLALLLLHMVRGTFPQPQAGGRYSIPASFPPTLSVLVNDCLGDISATPPAAALLQRLQAAQAELVAASYSPQTTNRPTPFQASWRTTSTPSSPSTAGPSPHYTPQPSPGPSTSRAAPSPSPPHPNAPSPSKPNDAVTSADPLGLVTLISAGEGDTPQQAASRLTSLLSNPPPTLSKIDTFAAISPLLHLLGHRTNPWAAATACRILTDACNASNEAKWALIDSGGVPHLRSLLTPSTNRPAESITYATSIISTLNSTPDTQVLIIEGGIIPPLIRLADPVSNPPDICASAVHALYTLAPNPLAKAAIAEFQGVHPLIRLLAPPNPQPHPAALGALNTLLLLSSDDHLRLMITEWGAPAPLAALVRPETNLAFLEPAAKLLHMLAYISHNRTHLVHAGVVVAMMGVLQCNNPSVVRAATGTLSFLAQGLQIAQVEITESGCLKPLLHLLRNPTMPPEVLQCILRALTHVIAGYRKAAEVVSARANRGAPTLVGLLQHPETIVVLETLAVMKSLVLYPVGRTALKREGAHNALQQVAVHPNRDVQWVAAEVASHVRPKGFFW